jgi:hypothetical protein
VKDMGAEKIPEYIVKAIAEVIAGLFGFGR